MEDGEEEEASKRRRHQGSPRDRERRGSRRSKDEDSVGRQRGGSARELKQRSQRAREKGIKKSRSWRSDSVHEGDRDPPELADFGLLETKPSTGTAVSSGVVPVDTAQLEGELDALFAGARRWMGDELPGSPANGRGASGRGLLATPTAPECFAAGRQYPLDTMPDGSLPPVDQKLYCPPELFNQVYSAWLWGLGEATLECQRTQLEYREKKVEGKTGIVEKVIKYTANRKSRDKCLEDVGKLLGQVEAAQRAYCSNRSLEAVNCDWAGQEFQESLTALSLWHEAHAEGSTLRWFLDAYSWAHDKHDQRHDRTHVWEGPQGQPQDQPRGLKWTIDRVIAYMNRRLLQADLEPGTDPNIFGRMAAKGLPMLIVHDVVKTLLALVVGARVSTSAEARAILPISRKVLDLALRQRNLHSSSGAGTEQLSLDPQFHRDTLRCFVRCFELVSTSGQLKRREVVTAGQQGKARPVQSYRLVGRSEYLEEFQTWSMHTATAIGEFLPSVAMVLSTGLLLLSKEVLRDDALHLLPGLAEALTPPEKRFVASDDESHEMHGARVFSIMRDWLLKGNLGVVKQCCKQVHLSSTLRVGDVGAYNAFVEALHKEDYYFLKVTKANLTDVCTSDFAALNVTSDCSCPGRVSTDLDLRQHLFAGSEKNQKQQDKECKLFAIPGSLAKPASWLIIRRFAETGFQFADDGHDLVRAGSDGSDAPDVLMSDIHILLLDASRMPNDTRDSLGLRFLPTNEVLPSPPAMLFDIALAPYGVRVLAASHRQLIDTRSSLVNMASDRCGVELEVTATAEAPFASTNKMLDEVYDTAINGVECLFMEARGSGSTVAAQQLWNLGFEYGREVCRLGLRAPEAARLQKLVREYEPEYRSVSDCASPRAPQIMRVLSGQSLRRSRSLDNVQAGAPSNKGYWSAFTRQSKSASDLVACARGDIPPDCIHVVEVSTVIDFDSWSKSGASDFGEQFIREFEQQFGTPGQKHPWDDTPRPNDGCTVTQQEITVLQVLQDKCRRADPPRARYWVIHFAVCSPVSRRDAQEKLFCNGGIMDRLHRRAGVQVGQVLEIRDSYVDSSTDDRNRVQDEDMAVSLVRRVDVFAHRSKRQHVLQDNFLELYHESQSARVTGIKRQKALERLHCQLRDYLLGELYKVDLPSMRATGDAIEDGKRREQLEHELERLPQSVQGASSYGDCLISRAELDGVDARALIKETLAYEGGNCGVPEYQHVPTRLGEKRQREAKMREDCAGVPHHRLLQKQTSMSTSILQQLSGLDLHAAIKAAKSVQIDDMMLYRANREEDKKAAVIALIQEKATAVDLVIQQNRRLIEEVVKRQLSEIRADVVEGRADIRVLGVCGAPECCEIEFEVTASTPARRDELAAALQGSAAGVGLSRRRGRSSQLSAPSVPPQCERNQLTLFVSSLCAHDPYFHAQHQSVGWRAAAQIASEATARQCISIERELIRKKLDFVKVDLAQTEEQARRRLRLLSRSALSERVRKLAHVDSKLVRKVRSSLQGASPSEKVEGMVKLVASLEETTKLRAIQALKNKLGFGFRLPQLYCGLCRLPLDWQENDERASVSLGRDSAYSHLYYCGRRLSPDKFEDSLTEGTCGPGGGSQCKSCQRYQSAQVGESTSGAFAALNLWAGHAKTDGAEIQWDDLKRVQPDSLLGTGTTGQVHKMTWTSAGGLVVAVKVFTPDHRGVTPEHGPTKLEQFKNESEMLARLRHKHVLELYGHCFSPKRSPMLVMELCEGSVSEALRHDIARPISWNKRCGVHVLDCNWEERRSWVAAQQRLAFARGIVCISHGRSLGSSDDELPDSRAQLLFQGLAEHLRDTYTHHTVDHHGHRQSRLHEDAGRLLHRIGAQIQKPSDRVVTEAHSRPHNSWQVRLQWASGVAKGLTYLHSQQIVHSDLKADNVLIAPGNVAKLCDFSFSQLRAYGQVEMCVGTPGYNDGSSGEPGDIFSFGIMLWEVIFGMLPLPRSPHSSIHHPRSECTRLRCPLYALNVVEQESMGFRSHPPENCLYNPVQSGARLDHWFGPGSTLPLEKYSAILARCVADVPTQRPSAETVVAMLEEIRESDAQAEHLWHLHLRARTVKRMASYRLAAEEPAVAQIAVGATPLPQRRHDQERGAQQSSTTLGTTVAAQVGGTGAAGQAQAARVARSVQLQAPDTNGSTQPVTSARGASTPENVAPMASGLVPPDAANLFRFQPHEANYHDEQQQHEEDEEARHFDAADEYEEYHHRNTAAKRWSHI